VSADQNPRPALSITLVPIHSVSLPSARLSNTLPSLHFQSLTSIKFCNSFVLIFIQNARGCGCTPLPVLSHDFRASRCVHSAFSVISASNLSFLFDPQRSTFTRVSSPSSSSTSQPSNLLTCNVLRLNSFPCYTYENLPVSPIIATLPKTPSHKSFACHTSKTPWGGPTRSRRSRAGWNCIS
jgi:hypothetical protein